MVTIKEASEKYERKVMNNIADLPAVDVSEIIVEDEERLDKDGKKYKVSYLIRNDEEYRVVGSVLEQLKAIIKEKPDLKTFKVNKIGSGQFGTKYQVISLE